MSSKHDPDAEMTAENVPECMGHTVLDDGEEGITETDVQEAAVDAISDDKASPETAPSHTFKGAIHPSPQSLLCQTSPAETSTTTEEFNPFFTGLSLACATSKPPLLEGGNPGFTGVATPFPTATTTQINGGNGNIFGGNGATSEPQLLEGGNPGFTGIATPFPTATTAQINGGNGNIFGGNGNMFGMNVRGQPLVAGFHFPDEIGASGFRDEGTSSYSCDFLTKKLNGFPAHQVTPSLNVSSDLWLPNGEITPPGISFTQGAFLLLLFFIRDLITKKVFQKVVFYEPSMNR